MKMMMHFLLLLRYQWHLELTRALRRLALISLHLMVFARNCCDSFLWKMTIFHMQLFFSLFSFQHKTITFFYFRFVLFCCYCKDEEEEWRHVSSIFNLYQIMQWLLICWEWFLLLRSLLFVFFRGFANFLVEFMMFMWNKYTMCSNAW